MKKYIFDFTNYKPYLLNFIEAQPKKGYGFRTKLADLIDCKPAFLSQIFNGAANFNFEQAEAIAAYLKLNDDEIEYFFLLLQYARAGSKGLELRLKKQIDKKLKQRLVLKNRVDIKQELSVTDQQTYYSSWIYAAIHILVTIKSYRTKDKIAEQLCLPLPKVTFALEFLASIGLVKFEAGKFIPGPTRIFLGNDSKMILQHHTNWRIKAVDSLNKDLESNMHLSTVVSIAAKDVLTIKEILSKSIDSARALIRESAPEDELYCFNLDFFKINL